MGSERVEGPDFICIGMIKAGTGWLFDQLKHHPDFWMPPVKEIRYLGAKRSRMSAVEKRLGRFARPGGAKRGRDERDNLFLRDAAELRGNPNDYRQYAALFRHKGDRLSGDVSPMYSRLKNEQVAEIARNLPQAKIILLVRDPVARAWSGISMLHRHGRFDASVLEEPRRFKEYFRAAHRIENRSSPSRIVTRWREHAPRMAFRYFFFDDIAASPERARADILAYLGADPKKSSGEVPPDHNQKAAASKLPLSEPIKQVLVEHFREELQDCAEVLGGPAISWVVRYGLSPRTCLT